MEGDEERIEVKRDLPSPAAISILQFHTRKKKKSGNWQPVILRLSDHELLMGTLVPSSLGTGTLCYFEGPTVFSESSRGRDGNVFFFVFFITHKIF